MPIAGILGVRDWRQHRGIGLEHIAESTKLSVRLLRAIEDGEFEKLPGGIYNTNYIRQYANAIGFDEQDLLSYYRQSYLKQEIAQEKQNPPSGKMTGPIFQH